MSKKPKKKVSAYKRARAIMQHNLSMHAVIFTASLGQSYFVNRISPGRKTCISKNTEAHFDPDSPAYNYFRFSWDVYPVVVTKNAFGEIAKTKILDTGFIVQNAHWKQATEYAIEKGNEFLAETPFKFRANVGFVFLLAGTKVTTDHLERIIGQDKNFFTVDETGERELRTNEEIKRDDLELIKKLEEVA